MLCKCGSFELHAVGKIVQLKASTFQCIKFGFGVVYKQQSDSMPERICPASHLDIPACYLAD